MWGRDARRFRVRDGLPRSSGTCRRGVDPSAPGSPRASTRATRRMPRPCSRSCRRFRDRLARPARAGLGRRRRRLRHTVADNVPELAQRLAVLQVERDEVRARLAAVSPAVSLEELRDAIEGPLAELREVLSSLAGRQALQALLGGERLTVVPDPELGFRVEGAVRVGPDMLVAGGATSSRRWRRRGPRTAAPGS